MLRFSDPDNFIEEQIAYTKILAEKTFNEQSPNLLAIDDLSVQTIGTFGQV